MLCGGEILPHTSFPMHATALDANGHIAADQPHRKLQARGCQAARSSQLSARSTWTQWKAKSTKLQSLQHAASRPTLGPSRCLPQAPKLLPEHSTFLNHVPDRHVLPCMPPCAAATPAVGMQPAGPKHSRRGVAVEQVQWGEGCAGADWYKAMAALQVGGPSMSCCQCQCCTHCGWTKGAKPTHTSATPLP